MNLIQTQKQFSTQKKCVKYLEALRWGKIPKCPYCNSERTIRAKSEVSRHHCYACKRSFTVFVNTIFEDTRQPLPTWFLVISLVLNSKMGISAKEIQRQLGVTLKTAWFTAMKIRCAMISHNTQLHGVLEMDESYFGSTSKKLNKLTDKSNAVISTVATVKKRGRGTKKIPVVGIVEKGGNVQTKVIEKLTARNLMAMLKHYANTQDSVLVTDGFRSYAKMEEAIEHITVKHANRTGKLNTNTIEGYWSLIKNGIRGNYRSLSQKYLPFYLVEYDYKYNNRNNKNIFEDFIKSALTDESCMLNYSPVKDPKTIVYQN